MHGEVPKDTSAGGINSGKATAETVCDNDSTAIAEQYSARRKWERNFGLQVGLSGGIEGQQRYRRWPERGNCDQSSVTADSQIHRRQGQGMLIKQMQFAGCRTRFQDQKFTGGIIKCEQKASGGFDSTESSCDLPLIDDAE
ncbi:hypothetical protein LBMAG46_18920 [Planctomycetia bacterium]|nr:hypothetical protein LBMAG46_18920 [Planctomycetia bacterium]